MARIGDFYSWATDAVAVRAYVGLGVSTAEDTNLELWYSAAIAMAERRVNRDFNDGADPPVGVDPPDDATLAILEGVKAMRTQFRRGVGVTGVKTDSLEEDYTDETAMRAMVAAMNPYLVQLRLNVHLEGGGG